MRLGDDVLLSEIHPDLQQLTPRSEPAAPLSIGWRSLGAVTGIQREARGAVLECGAARLRLTVERAGIIRVRLAPSGEFARDFSWAVMTEDVSLHISESARQEPRAPEWHLDESMTHVDLISERITVRIRRNPCRLSFVTPEGRVCAADEISRGITWDGSAIACWKQLGADEHFFGLGEKGLPFDKRGTSVVNWNSDVYEHEPWTDPIYQTHPVLLSLEKGRCYGLFFDNTYRSWFDLGKTARDSYGFGADGGEMNYYFIPGPTPADVLGRLARLIGTNALPPLWALGYQQCRWSYESAARVRKLAAEFRRRRIPCDVIYLDIDYMDEYRCFTWNRTTFPKPAQLMRELRKKGFRVVTILDPGIKQDRGYATYDSGLAGNHFCRLPEGDVYVGKVWPGESVFPDFTRPATRQWWGEQYAGLVADGVAGFWNDMNEPADFSAPDKNAPLNLQHDMDGAPGDHRAAHNVYGMQMARGTYEGVLRQRPGERPFVLTRAGFSGVQRYAASWTGDNLSSWDHLRMSVPMLLNMGLSGLTFAGADVGGFREHPTPELFTRWIQLGIFYPLFRAHTAGGPEQEPWSFGAKYERLNRRAIELRYRMLPYLYTEMEHAARTGLPVMRPLLADFPGHPDVHAIGHEFMFGRQMLVAPVLEPGATHRKIKLPEGEWWRWDPITDSVERHVGALQLEKVASVLTGRDVAVETRVPVALESIPIFARAGAIIPMREVCQHTDERPLKLLTLDVFPGEGVGTFYCDDGRSFAYRDGAYVRESYSVRDCGNEVRFELTARDGDESFAPPAYMLKFHGRRVRPVGVTIENEPLSFVASASSLAKKPWGWSFDRRSGIIWVKVSELQIWRPILVSEASDKRGGPAARRRRH